MHSSNDFKLASLLIERATITQLWIDTDSITANLDDEKFQIKYYLKNSPEAQEFKKKYIEQRRGLCRFKLKDFKLINVDEIIEEKRTKEEEKKEKKL